MTATYRINLNIKSIKEHLKFVKQNAPYDEDCLLGWRLIARELPLEVCVKFTDYFKSISIEKKYTTEDVKELFIHWLANNIK